MISKLTREDMKKIKGLPEKRNELIIEDIESLKKEMNDKVNLNCLNKMREIINVN